MDEDESGQIQLVVKKNSLPRELINTLFHGYKIFHVVMFSG